MKSPQLALTLCVTGTLFAAFVSFHEVETTGESADIWFPLIFILGPWLILDVVFSLLRWARSIAISAALMFVLELIIYVGVFINPQSSTDAVAYVFKPRIQVLVLLPLGLFIGRAIDKRKETSNISHKVHS